MDKSLLHYFVRDALGPYSEDFRIFDRQNPIVLGLNEHVYSIHVSYVHDSGNARENEDEVRIQISRHLIETQRARHEAGQRVAFLGFFPSGKIFVAWDPRHVFSLQARTIVSVYARQSQFEDVEAFQAAAHRFEARLLGETSFAIALPSNTLGFYLENIEHFHRLPNETSIRQLIQNHLNTFDDSGLGASGEFDITAEGTRERFVYERKSFPRDPNFAKAVLAAYDRSCCICNRQLGLVQAAHIIPHSEYDSPNEVQNGLAMCIEHHRLYDDALLLPGPGRRLVFNEDRATFLRDTGQGRGLEEIKAIANREYSVPRDARWHPRDDYLQRGLEIRLG